MRGVWVSENLQKLLGVVVMAVLVVVGVVVSSGDDTDFTRNAAMLIGNSGDQDELAELSQRIERLESALKNEELRAIVAYANELASVLRTLETQSAESVGRVERTERRLAEAYEFASQRIENLEAEQGWVQTLDLMCQQQLSSWGRAATVADAIWDPGNPNAEIPSFWACRYDNLNIPELEGVQLSERVGVCLPGDQSIVMRLGRTRGQGFEAIFAESINRWVFQFNPSVEANQFQGANFLFDAACG